jgi:hypothetical protein
MNMPLLPVTLIAAFALQATGERMGFWESSNEGRLFLGLVAGGAVNLLLTPLTFHFLGCKARESANRPGAYWGAYVLLSTTFMVLARAQGTPLVLVGLSLGGLLLIFALLNVAVAAAFFKFADRERFAAAWTRLTWLVLVLFGGEWLVLKLIR